MNKPIPTEQRILLSDVSWQKFEELLQELGDHRTTRVTYDRGKLEMMNVLPEHDRCSRLIESLILVLVDELGEGVASHFPVLLTSKVRGRAAEFDTGYVVGTEPPYALERRCDIDRFPPPDLVVEVAINKSKLDHFPIYADLDVPEIWRYVTQPGEEVLKGSLAIYQLQNLQYVETTRSALFPMLPARRILEFIEQSDNIGLVQALQIFRHWVKSSHS